MDAWNNPVAFHVRYTLLTAATLTTSMPSSIFSCTGTEARHVLNVDGSVTYFGGILVLLYYICWYTVCVIFPIGILRSLNRLKETMNLFWFRGVCR